MNINSILTKLTQMAQLAQKEYFCKMKFLQDKLNKKNTLEEMSESELLEHIKVLEQIDHLQKEELNRMEELNQIEELNRMKKLRKMEELLIGLKKSINSKDSKGIRKLLNESEKHFGILGIKELKTDGNNSTIYELELQQKFIHLKQQFLLKIIHSNNKYTIDQSNKEIKEINYLKLISPSIYECSFIFSKKKCKITYKYVCIIMKKMRSDLANYITDQTNLNGISIPELFIQLMPQIITLLQLLIDNNIIHNDLKTPNILVDESGQLFLSDFGLTQQLDPVLDTKIGSIGTYAFTHPSDFKHSRYGSGTDLYSMGMSILYTITNLYIEQKKYNALYIDRFNTLYKDTIKDLYMNTNHRKLFQSLELLLNITFNPFSGKIYTFDSGSLHHGNTKQRICALYNLFPRQII